ncbi:gluconokinase [Photobacterium sp. MCCC 1A19761]|uniref:gluconokinase n=1 Tax=Photobacterium sp. MCCC 1A19761 TaxID=3115000 RepID=UPI00307E0523
MKPKKVLVMGVSGCGKSLIGSKIAAALGLTFFDGDDYHPPENVAKMREGIPLTDADRYGWLRTLNQLFVERDTAVVACSALKAHYRDILRENNPELVIVYLQGTFDTIWLRHQQRANHYFNGEAMLRSQFEALEEPVAGEALFIDIRQDVDAVVSAALSAIEETCHA